MCTVQRIMVSYRRAITTSAYLTPTSKSIFLRLCEYSSANPISGESGVLSSRKIAWGLHTSMALYNLYTN